MTQKEKIARLERRVVFLEAELLRARPPPIEYHNHYHWDNAKPSPYHPQVPWYSPNDWPLGPTITCGGTTTDTMRVTS